MSTLADRIAAARKGAVRREAPHEARRDSQRDGRPEWVRRAQERDLPAQAAVSTERW